LLETSFRTKRLAIGVLLAVLGSFAAAGCDGSKLATPSGASGPGPDPLEEIDAGSPADDAAPVVDDGTPTRGACSSTFGSGLSPTHGRLDGRLVAVVGANEFACHADATHLHLQVEMKGAVYDIAVNLDGYEGETDVPLPGAPFSEGWHMTDLDYVASFGLHSTSLTLNGIPAMRARLEAVLANANHISVYGTAYPGSDGAHLVHRQSAGNDGAIVIQPLAATAHVIAFRFESDTF
jgi:hypothetical protein